MCLQIFFQISFFLEMITYIIFINIESFQMYYWLSCNHINLKFFIMFIFTSWHTFFLHYIIRILTMSRRQHIARVRLAQIQLCHDRCKHRLNFNQCFTSWPFLCSLQFDLRDFWLNRLDYTPFLSAFLTFSEHSHSTRDLRALNHVIRSSLISASHETKFVHLYNPHMIFFYSASP